MTNCCVLRLHVPEFVEAENWPRNSTDLNPVNYLIWGALQQLVNRRRRTRDVEHMKEILQTCWEQIGRDVIDHVIGQTIVGRCCNRWRTH